MHFSARKTTGTARATAGTTQRLETGSRCTRTSRSERTIRHKTMHETELKSGYATEKKNTTPKRSLFVLCAECMTLFMTEFDGPHAFTFMGRTTSNVASSLVLTVCKSCEIGTENAIVMQIQPQARCRPPTSIATTSALMVQSSDAYKNACVIACQRVYVHAVSSKAVFESMKQIVYEIPIPGRLAVVVPCSGAGPETNTIRIERTPSYLIWSRSESETVISAVSEIMNTLKSLNLSANGSKPTFLYMFKCVSPFRRVLAGLLSSSYLSLVLAMTRCEPTLREMQMMRDMFREVTDYPFELRSMNERGFRTTLVGVDLPMLVSRITSPLKYARIFGWLRKISIFCTTLNVGVIELMKQGSNTNEARTTLSLTHRSPDEWICEGSCLLDGVTGYTRLNGIRALDWFTNGSALLNNIRLMSWSLEQDLPATGGISLPVLVDAGERLVTFDDPYQHTYSMSLDCTNPTLRTHENAYTAPDGIAMPISTRIQWTPTAMLAPLIYVPI